MSAVLEVLQIVAPVLILAGFGYIWVRVGWPFELQFVTRLTMTVSVPCLIFVGLARADIEPGALGTLIGASLATYIGVGILALIVSLIFGLHLRTYLAPMIFGNTGNVGLPLTLFAFGQQGMELALVVFAVMAILSFTVGVWMVSGGASPKKALQEPMTYATLLGLAFLWFQWPIPEWTQNTLELIGQMGIPLMLLTLGVAIARLKPASIGRATVISVVKLAICIAVPIGVAHLFGITGVAAAVLLLQVAMPVAVTSYMLAEKYDADAPEVAGLVVVSTLMAIGALPLILGFLV